MNSITRRTVIWSVPVVSMVVAAPAMAASQPVYIETVRDSCKYPGQSVPGKEYGYHMVVDFSSTLAGTVTINSLSTSKNDTTDITPSTFALAAGTTTVAFDVFSANSANQTATITYTFTAAGGTTSETYTQVITFPSFKPCK